MSLALTMLTALATFTLLAALAGCTGDAPPAAAGASTASASARESTAAGPLGRTGGAGERERVQDTYRRFWEVTATVSSRPPSTWPSLLSSVAADPLLTSLLEGYAAEQRRGVVEFGSVAPRPALLDLRADRASIVDCQDASASGQVNLSSGEPTRIGSARTAVGAVLRRQPDGSWRVAQVRYLEDPC